MCLRLRRLTPTSRALATLFLLSAASLLSAATTLSTNLSEKPTDTEIIAGPIWVAASFRTDHSSYLLDNVTLGLLESVSGSARLSLFAADGPQPGSLLGTLFSPASYSAVLTDTSFVGNALALVPDSTYWLVLSAPTGSFSWAWTESNVGSRSGFQTNQAVIEDSGSHWGSFTSEPLLMRVDVNPTHELDWLAPFLAAAAVWALFARMRTCHRRSGSVPSSLLRAAYNRRHLVSALGVRPILAILPAQSTTTLLLLGCLSIGMFATENSRGHHELHSFQPTLNSPRSSLSGQPNDELKIISPQFGQTLTGSPVTISFVLGSTMDRESLHIRLNGHDVTAKFPGSACQGQACVVKGRFTPWDGLRRGDNQLQISASSFDKHVALRHLHFDYVYSSLSDSSAGPWLPLAVGLSLNPGGALPWVTLTTGTPENLQDNIDTTQYSTPYPDMTFPLSTDTPCNQQLYQVLVLDRRNPASTASPYAYSCYNDSSSLKSYLTSLPAGNEIVIVGTTWGSNVDGGLDTSSIGGTDYSNTPAANYPQGYAIIGVPGAKAGSAYESYYLASEVGKPYQQNPFATGLLAADQAGNYNFHAGNNVQFEVYPNNPNESGYSSVYVNQGTYVWGFYPPAANVNGFWLLVLDRVTLEPVDSSTDASSNCNPAQGYGANYNLCGTLYPTGSTDGPTSYNAILDLAGALANVTTRQLAILTTTGQPFQSLASLIFLPPTYALPQAIDALGGSRYTLLSLGFPTATYTLVAPGTLQPRSPFSSDVVLSSSAFIQQKQTGIVRGVLARDSNGLYKPLVFSQEDGQFNGENATILSANFDLYQIASQSPADWPLTDTSAHIAAYHYASSVYLNSHYQETGSHSQDLRYFYQGNAGYAQYNTDFLDKDSNGQWNNQACLENNTVPANAAFSLQELCDTRQQLYNELTAVYGTYHYLDEQLGGLVRGDDQNPGIATAAITAASTTLSDQTFPTSASVSSSASNWVGLVSSLTGLASSVLGPEADIASAGLGAVSGLLATGSALAPFASNDEQTPTNYESTYDTTLAQLVQEATTYQQNLAKSYATALELIYSDWSKISAVGSRTSDSDSGWSFHNEFTATDIANVIAQGASRSLYLQILPQFFWLDAYVGAPVSDVAKLGTLYIDYPYEGVKQQVCNASYPLSLPSNGYASYYSYISYSRSTPTVNDIYVIGGAISNQGKTSVSESLPSAALLNTLFGVPNPDDSSTSGYLNIPTDLVYSSDGANGGFLTYRGGPNQGNGSCYKPGCQGDTSSTNCVGP